MAEPAPPKPTTELTYAEVANHASKKDVYLVVHDKVYDATAFVDEHPGGEEVMLDVAGQDATEAFEDVGHSDEAREILDGLLIGGLKRLPGDPTPKASAPTSSTKGANDSGAGAAMGVGLYAVILGGGLAAWVAYKYLLAQQGKEA